MDRIEGKIDAARRPGPSPDQAAATRTLRRLGWSVYDALVWLVKAVPVLVAGAVIILIVGLVLAILTAITGAGGTLGSTTL